MIISKGRIFEDYRKAKTLLKKLEIEFYEELEKAKSLKKDDFSQEFIKASYKSDYKDIYKIARDNSDYNLLINSDGAIFQFGYAENERNQICDLRYAYYESPSEQISYEDFLILFDLDIQECGYELMEEYTQYISESELKTSVTPIRYDYSVEQYSELIHPVSHVHIGQLNEIRIPTSFIMTPLNFVAFVLRHIYWNKWRLYMENDELREHYLNSYSSTTTISSQNFSLEEKRDIFLNI